MNKLAILVILCLAALSGCGSKGGTTAASGGSTSTAPDGKKTIVGRWVGKPEIPKDQKEPGAEFAAGMLQMMGNVRLEFASEDKFKITMLGMPIEGSVVRKGDTLVLTPERVMGMKPEEAAKNDPKAKDPIELKVSEDGETLSTITKDSTDPPLVFTRAKPEPPTKVTLTDPKDLELVGKWKGRIDAPEPGPDATAAEKDEYRMTQAMNDSITLDLKGDGSFSMSMVMDIEGKWTRKGDTVTISPGAILGIEMNKEEKADPNNQPLVGEVSNGGKTITIKHKDPKKGVLILTKE